MAAPLQAQNRGVMSRTRNRLTRRAVTELTGGLGKHCDRLRPREASSLKMRRASGFTLIEVLVALLLGTIGLLGTLAVQQAVISASKAANDSAVALRLASRKLEEFSTALTTGNPSNPLPAPYPAYVDQLAPLATGNWSAATYLNSEGIAQDTKSAAFRWSLRWRVTNTGAGNPYVMAVAVTYDSDTGNPKTVRLDLERRKSW